MNIKNISVVGGGWSFSKIDRSKLPRPIIGINEAGVLLNTVDYIVSMDRLWTENRWHKIRERQHIPFYVRRAAIKNIDVTNYSNVIVFDCDYKTCIPTFEDGHLNGTNSGACGINLALRFNPKTIWLFGFDMSRSPDGTAYWHKPYEWTASIGATKDGKYIQWANEMRMLAMEAKKRNIRILNVTDAKGTIKKVFETISIVDFRLATREM